MNMPARMGAALAAVLLCCNAAAAQEKIKVLLIDGQNNHNWRATSPVLKKALEETGRFTVDVVTTPGDAPRAPGKPKGELTAEQKAAYEKALADYEKNKAAAEAAAKDGWAAFRPKFADYGVVVSNYNGKRWPAEVEKGLVDFVSGGGGLVVVHAADNAFPDWPEYNEMIAVGGWGGRSEKSGPYIRLREGKFVNDTTPGRGGSHGPQHAFVVVTRNAEHPITKGLPEVWMHAQDELYDRLRGPAKNVTVLATAFADSKKGGSGEHEPMLMVVDYGKGRVFHTTLGHSDAAMKCVGFRVTLARGTEWVATGKVTLTELPKDFPTAEKVSTRE